MMENVKEFHFGIKPFLKSRLIKVIIISISFLLNNNIFSQSENLPDGSQVRDPGHLSLREKSAIKNLESGINELISDPFFDKTLIAIDIFDLTDSISLYQKNEKLLLLDV